MLGLMCLAQGHTAMTPVRLDPAAPREEFAVTNIKTSGHDPGFLERGFMCIKVWWFCLFDLILYVPSKIFQL